MRKIKLCFVFSICLIGLTGCITTQDNYGVTGKPRPLSLQQQMTFYGASFPENKSALTAGEKENIREFIGQVRLDEGDEVAVSFKGNNEINMTRSRVVADYLRSLNLTPKIMGEVGDIGPNEVGVIRIHYIVLTPNCPDWSYPNGVDYANNTTSNFNCATQTNLGLMVANPKDLFNARDMSGQDANAGVLAVQRYRAGKTTPLMEDGPTKKKD